MGVQIANSNAVGYINSGDWVKYEGVDFGLGANSIEVSAATKTSGGRIEIRKESVTGEIIGEIEVSNTGSFTSFETLIADFPIVSGKQDIYLVFNGGSGYLFDVNWFKFISVGLGINHGFYDSNEPSLFPNPVHAKLTIKKSALSVLSIYDISGNKILSKNITSDSHVVDLSKLSIGVYFVEIINKTSRKVIKLIKD